MIYNIIFFLCSYLFGCLLAWLLLKSWRCFTYQVGSVFRIPSPGFKEGYLEVKIVKLGWWTMQIEGFNKNPTSWPYSSFRTAKYMTPLQVQTEKAKLL